MSCRQPAGRRCSRARPVRTRSSITPAPASTCARSATRSTRCSASACRRRHRRCPGGTRSSTSAATTRRSSCRRPMASGSRSKNASRRSSRRSRIPAGRSTLVPRRRPIPCSACRATPVSTCTGRATAAVSTGRWGPSSSRESSTNSFTFVEGASDKAAEPEAKGLPIGFTVKGDMPTGIVALVGARVITMASLAAGPIQGTPGVIENATVIVDGNRITAVGPSSSVPVPAGAHAHRRQGPDDHARHHRRARASRRRVERPYCANELAARRQSGVRRHDLARSVERQRDGIHQRRARARRAEDRAARVLDRHHSLRRRDAIQGGGRQLRRCAVARAAAEGDRRDQRQELQPAAARRAADDRQGVARA